MRTGCRVNVKQPGGGVKAGTLFDVEHDRGIAIVDTAEGERIRVPVAQVEEVVDPNQPQLGPMGNWSRI